MQQVNQNVVIKILLLAYQSQLFLGSHPGFYIFFHHSYHGGLNLFLQNSYESAFCNLATQNYNTVKPH